MRFDPIVWILLVLPFGAVRLFAEEAVGEYARMVSAEPNLVAHWRFEGDTRDSRDVANGEVRGGEAQYVPGPGGGKAILLEKGRFLTMGAAPRLDLPQMTVELWFRPAAKPGTTTYNPCLIAKRESSPGTRFSVHLWTDYATLGFWNGRNVVRFAPPGGPIREGQWYYLAMTCTDKQTRIYLDGVPCQLLDSPAAISFKAVNLPLQIAASAPKGEEHFASAIDEVAIYSRALSDEEIIRHADAMGWKEQREKLLGLEKERQQRDMALANMREVARGVKLKDMLSDRTLFDRGQPRVYRGERLTGISMPVGGIAAGAIQIDGSAARPIWQIFNNFQGVGVPDSFFAVRVKAGEAAPIVRALQTAPVGPFAGMKELTFRGEYPFAWFAFQDDQVPVKLSLETFSPLVPLEAKDSAIPCAIYSLTAENPAAKPVEVSFLAAQQNAVGYTGKGQIKERTADGYGGNSNRVLREEGATVLHMTAKQEKLTSGSGDMALMAVSGDATGTASWENLEKLAEAFSRDGSASGPETAGPSAAGQTIDGALASSFKLNPGERKTVTFVLTWHFPQARHGGGQWGGAGNMYANWWVDALAVAKDLKKRLPELTASTRLYHDTLYASNLPYWLLDRISSQVAILSSRTCFWTKDGYFGGWEGCGPSGGCCQGNCGHVWHYAQAHARLFPEIARRMREEALKCQAPDGAIFFRQPKTGIACDAQSGEVLEAYREHLTSADRKWLDAHWGGVRKAMEFSIHRWDADEDGVLSGAQHNTLDADSSGSSSWLGSLYLAALAAGEKMAELEGDADAAARYARIRRSGMKKQDETLWNGEYYIQIPDPKPLRDYGGGCHIDQVLGQWWAHQLDLGWVYPAERVRGALGALLKYNFRADFRGIRQAPRKFVADDDAGSQMIQWPKGDRPANHMMYADEAMTGFEYAAAATMVQAGMLREGLLVVRAVCDRYDGRLRTGLTGGGSASWGYSGNPFGDDECGKFYARAMSVWSMLLACQGFIYDGPAGLIGFRPVWRAEDHCSLFTAAEGWGLFTQRRAEGKQTERIEVKRGKLSVKTLIFELPADAKPAGVTISLGGEALKSTFALKQGRLTISLESPVTVSEGKTLEAMIGL